MLKDLKLLEELQNIDSHIAEIEKNKRENPGRIEELQQLLQKAKSDIETLKKDLLEFEKKKKTLELDLADLEEKVKNGQSRLMQSKSNEEYKASLKEIDNHKLEISIKEEELLELMEKLDQLHIQFKKTQSEVSEQEKGITAQIQIIQSETEHIDAALAVENDKRNEKLKGIDHSTLALYNKIRQKKWGIAVVPTTEGRCSGCNMNIPPQLYNEIRRGEEILCCPNCQRILVWKNVEEATQTPS